MPLCYWWLFDVSSQRDDFGYRHAVIFGWIETSLKSMAKALSLVHPLLGLRQTLEHCNDETSIKVNQQHHTQYCDSAIRQQAVPYRFCHAIFKTRVLQEARAQHIAS